jgi:hypothetical protein
LPVPFLTADIEPNLLREKLFRFRLEAPFVS